MSTVCQTGVYSNDAGESLDVLGEATGPDSSIAPFATLGGIYYALGAMSPEGRPRLLVTAESLQAHGYRWVSDLFESKVAVVPVSVLASAIITMRSPDHLKHKGVSGLG